MTGDTLVPTDLFDDLDEDDEEFGDLWDDEGFWDDLDDETYDPEIGPEELAVEGEIRDMEYAYGDWKGDLGTLVL